MDQECNSNSISKLLKFYLQFIIVWIAFFFILAILLAFLFGLDGKTIDNNTDKTLVLLSIIIPQILVFLLPALVFSFKEGSMKQILRLQWNFPTIWMIPILIGWLSLDLFSSAFISLTVFILPEQASIWMTNELLNVESLYLSTFGILGNDFIGICLVIISGALVPAFCEEFLFRGTFLNRTVEFISPYKSLIISSLLFAFVHLQLIMIPQLFIFGFYLGLVVIMTKSIYPAIIIHFLNNTSAFLMLMFGESSYLDVIRDYDDLMQQIGLLLLSLTVGLLVYKYFFKSKCSFEHQREHSSHT